MEHRTRVVKSHTDKPEPDNRCTRISRARWQLPDVASSLRSLPKHVRREWILRRSPGVFIAAMSATREAEWAWVAASGRPRALSIGRHDQCDVFLPIDDAVSLRHLLCMVRGAEEGVSAHVFDLSSSNETRGVDGEMVRAWRVVRPTVVTIPGHHVFFFPTGPGTSSSFSFEERRPPPRLASVLRPHELVFDTANVVVSGEHLARGVLIGRDERCLPTPLSAGDHLVSRVHALVVELGGEPVIADTGSTNGVRVNGAEVDARVLVPGDLVELGAQRFTWSVCEAAPPSRYERLIPSGIAEHLARLAPLAGRARKRAVAVFADWLLEHGSAWGEWISAELKGRTRAAELLGDELKSHVLGPLASIEVQFEHGIAIAGFVPSDARPLPTAHQSPHWKTLRRLVVPGAMFSEWSVTSAKAGFGGLLEVVEVDEP